MAQQNTQNGNLKVIKASAGSGKTFTLAKIYIEKLLWDETGQLRKQRNYHEHILAITFTNKATDEMKERIVERLDQLAQGTCKDYQDDFLRDHPSTNIEQLKEAAQNALKDILFDYSNFNVSTIDSFFQTILRTFAHELDRDDFEVQLDDDYVSIQAVHNFMASLSGNGGSKKWLEDYIHSSMQNQIGNKKDAIFFGRNSMSNILEFSKELYKESFIAHRAEIKNYLSDMGSGNGASRLSQFMAALSSKKKEHLDYCNSFHTTLKDFFNKINLNNDSLKGNSNIKKMAFDGLEYKDLKDLTTINGYIANHDGLIKCVKKANQDIALAHNDEFCGLLEKLVHHHTISKMLSEIGQRIYLLAFLHQIDNYIEQFRKENNMVLISDTNDLIAHVLHSGVDFVYERVGTWINNFMIDEFQDTSRKQYDNFKPLLSESLANANANLIIGDEKQSIYRFRNSDSDLLRTQIAEDFSSEYDDDKPLKTNFRSHEYVVKFNNEFFKDLTSNKYKDYEKVKATYGNVEQKVCDNKAQSNFKGHVRINVVPSSKDDALINADYVLNELPSYILHLHNDLHYPFGKILILVNTRADGDKAVECLLNHNKENPDQRIDIVSAESLKLKNSPSVRLIISVLQFLNNTIFHNSDDDSDEQTDAWSDVMKRRQFDKQFLNKLMHDFGKAMEKSGENADPSEVMTQVLRDNDELKKSTEEEQISIYSSITQSLMPNPYEESTGLESLVDRIIKQYVESTGALKNGGETAFILAFQNVVCDFCNMHNCGGSIYEFLKFWNSKKDKLSVESNGNGDAVEVMTIHSSKGLERACVIIPFANWTMIKEDKMVWLPRENWLSKNDKNKPFLGISNNESGECIVPPIIPCSGKMISDSQYFSEFQAPRTEEQLLDTINKTYVALTRAGQSLHIFAFGNDQTIAPLLCDFAKGNSSLFTAHTIKETHPGSTSDDIDYYEMGTEEEFDSSKKDDETNAAKIAMPDYHVSNNTGALKVSLPNYISDQQESGIRMHYILSRIRWKKDVKRALHYASRRIINTRKDPYWTLERVTEVVNNMFSDPKTAEWFADDNKVYNETSVFFLDAHQEFEQRRPDRIVVRPDGTTIVIDYKFGDAPTEKQRNSYNRQVKRYMSLLAKVGFSNIKGCVWYAKENTVSEVTL